MDELNEVLVFRQSQLTHNIAPHWGTSLDYVEHKKSGLKAVAITTAFFRMNALVGNRSVWEIDPKTKTAKVVSLQSWSAYDPTWHDGGIWKSTSLKAWAKHRKRLSKFLMGKWDLGRLHGRITDTLETYLSNLPE